MLKNGYCVYFTGLICQLLLYFGVGFGQIWHIPSWGFTEQILEITFVYYGSFRGLKRLVLQFNIGVR